MPGRFFLSHSSPDKTLVLAVYRALQTLHLDVWVDRFEIAVGDSLVHKIFDEGLEQSDYVCAFVTRFSNESRWVREELEHAFARAVREGKPKILVLRFDNAEVPSFLRSRRYASLDRHELGEIVNTILESAHLVDMNPTTIAAKPYATLDFHDAYEGGNILYLLASRSDVLDIDPYTDPEGIVFRQRHMFIFRVDKNDGAIVSRYMTKARQAHTAMRLLGSSLRVFINDKVENKDFGMVGRMYAFNADTLQPTSVDTVFSDKNWGWNPWIDENGLLHHKDFEVPGNPYRVGATALGHKDWHDLVALESGWRAKTCPFKTAHGPSRETGYLRFLSISENIFEDGAD